MTTIDDSTQTVDIETESNKGWQDVVSHAKEMQQAIEWYKSNYATSQDTNSTSSVTSQLSATGSAILTFVNTIADTVDPLIKSLTAAAASPNSGTPPTGGDAVSGITKKLADAQNAAMQALRKSLSEIGDTSQSTSGSSTSNDTKPNTTHAAVVAAPSAALPPDMQAIQDEFDRMGGKTDPRMGMGKIPPQFLPNTKT